MSGLRRPRVSLTSLGCKVNQYEMRDAAEDLLRRGFEVVPFGAPADACVVNTCSVTHEADVKSRAALRRAARCGDDPLVVATGCYADDRAGGGGAVDGVTAVVPNREKPRLAEVVEELLRRSGRLLFDLEEAPPAPPEGPAEPGGGTAGAHPGRAQGAGRLQPLLQFLHHPVRPGPADQPAAQAEVLAEARRLAAAGYRELVLTGICIGDYGDERGFPRPEDGRDPLARAAGQSWPGSRESRGCGSAPSIPRTISTT